MAIPIVGGSEQLSGYFPEPIGDVYWDERRVNPEMRFDGWKTPAWESWEDCLGTSAKR